LPASAADVKLQRAALDELKEHAALISPTHLGVACETVAEQACYLPSSKTGLPLLGKVAKGIYVNSGHVSLDELLSFNMLILLFVDLLGHM